METLIKYNDRNRNKFSQYFTPKIIVDFMIDLVDIHKNSKILEPSCSEYFSGAIATKKI